MLTLIVAHDKNRAIGRQGDIPWRAPEDLAAFQRETVGGALIMGRLTWDSLPRRPLPGRMNIVVTSRAVQDAPSAQTPFEAVGIAEDMGYQRIYGIGGAGIYTALLPLADRLLITEVDLEVEDADTFFPKVASQGWRETGRYALRGNGPLLLQKEYLRAHTAVRA